MFNDIVVVTKVLSSKAYLVYNKDMHMTLDMRLLHDSENLDPWIQLPMHSNIVNCYDIFDYQIGSKVYNFCVQEVTDGMGMIEHIDSLNLDLSK